jgi:hypothetical protein
VGGSYRGQFDFDPSSQIDYRLPSTTSAGFVAAYSSTGALTWATSLGENSNATGLAVDQQSVYASGIFSTLFSPNGSVSIPTSGGDDLFIAELSAAGAVQSAIGIGGAQMVRGRSTSSEFSMEQSTSTPILSLLMN